MTFDPAILNELPPPAQRYLRAAITDGHRIVRAATAAQEAEFFINNRWRALRATQRFSMTPPGFVWDARIRMAPLMPAYVRDSYVDGHASMKASLWGLYTVVNQADKRELNAGALQRFLGESVWFPTALLPSPSLSWTPRDEHSSFVTLSDHDTAVTLLFQFGDNGMPMMITGDRYKEDQGQYSLHTWQIFCHQATPQDGLTIPLRCEVAWVIDGMRQPYWRGRIASIEYQYQVME